MSDINYSMIKLGRISAACDWRRPFPSLAAPRRCGGGATCGSTVPTTDAARRCSGGVAARGAGSILGVAVRYVCEYVSLRGTTPWATGRIVRRAVSAMKT